MTKNAREPSDAPLSEGAQMWRRCGHGPGDGCPPQPPGGALPEPWAEVHRQAAEPATASSSPPDAQAGETGGVLSELERAYLARSGRCGRCGHSTAFHHTDDFSTTGYYFCRVDGCEHRNCDEPGGEDTGADAPEDAAEEHATFVGPDERTHTLLYGDVHESVHFDRRKPGEDGQTRWFAGHPDFDRRAPISAAAPGDVLFLSMASNCDEPGGEDTGSDAPEDATDEDEHATFVGPDGKTHTLLYGEVHEVVNCSGCAGG